MDSPVVVDTATEFGRGIDLDRAFPGFPFDDVEGFGRRGSDIRSHLDDLASRHPEFADHLLGTAWGDIPAFHNTGSLRNNRRRRRDSGSSSSHQGHPDEDARSHTSGSSAASGSSGVNSRVEPSRASAKNIFFNDSDETCAREKNSQDTSENPISQYDLRNTLDIGQDNRREMENNVRTSDNRGQRSMSAPPENRQRNEIPISSDEQQTDQQNPQNANHRFVSRVDITPQFVKPTSSSSSSCNEKASGEASKPLNNHQSTNNQQQKIPQAQSNVRHIPIFVEGRDEPIVPKNLENDRTDGANWNYGKGTRTESPTHPQFSTNSSQFTVPPQFHRPSHFNQHYTGGRARDWLPNFDEEFYGPQGGAANFQQPRMRRGQQQQPFAADGSPHQGQNYRQAQTETRAAPPQRQRNDNSGQRSHRASPQQQNQQPQQPQQQQQQQEEVTAEKTKKQKQPKDPLEKVAEVQKEIDSLNEQVILWNGKSRKDKDYMYLDEMLTRELIKLDDIETEGKENVRQARKNAIKCIQDSIGLLESKAPLNDPTECQVGTEIQLDTSVTLDKTEDRESNAMNFDDNHDGNKIIDNEQQGQLPIPLPAAPSTAAATLPENDDTIRLSRAENENANVTTRVPEVSSPTDIATIPETERSSTITAETAPIILPETSMMEVENSKSPKTAKKIRKTKKQQQQAPISDGAIPLPAPPSQSH